MQDDDVVRVSPIVLEERMGASYPRTLCRWKIQPNEKVVDVRVDGESVPFQYMPDSGVLGIFVSLPAYSKRVVEFDYLDSEHEHEKVWDVAKKRYEETEKGVVVYTARGGILLPPLRRVEYDRARDSLQVCAPIQKVLTPDGKWVGKGYIDTYERVSLVHCKIEEDGPLWTTFYVKYEIENGTYFEFRCTAAEGEDFVRIQEEGTCCGAKGRWVLQLDTASGMLPDSIDLANHTLYHEPRELTYFSDRLQARLFPWTQGTQIAQLHEGICVHNAAQNLTLGWFVQPHPKEWDGFKNTFVEFYERRLVLSNPRSRGGETIGETFSWLPPELEIGLNPHSAAFCAEAFLKYGSRSYGFFVGKYEDWHQPNPVPPHTLEWYEGPALLNEWEAARSPLRRIIQFHGLCSLDLVKDWDLDVPPTKDGLLTLEHPALESSYHSLQEYVGDVTANRDALLRTVRDELEVLAPGFVMARGPGGTNPVTLRCVFPYAILFRQMLREGLIPEHLSDEAPTLPPLASRLQAMLLFLAHLESRTSSYPGEYTMAHMSETKSSEPTCLGMPNENFLTDIFCLYGGVAMVFPNHPKAIKWIWRANWMLILQLDTFCDPESGIWEESHTYFNHVLRTLAPYLLEIRAISEVSPLWKARMDWFKDSRFQRLAQAALHFVTPRDPNSDGLRMMTTLGDHRRELHWHTFHSLALGFQEKQPTLAGNLAWLSIENGWKGSPIVKPIPPRLVSHTVRGLGTVLWGHHTLPDAGETMVILRAGYTWGHHNCDELEALFYSLGEPVIVEAGYGNPKTFSKVGSSGHSLMAPTAFDPAFYLSRANRGRITDFQDDRASLTQSTSGERTIGFMHPPAGTLIPIPIPINPYHQARTITLREFPETHETHLEIIDTHTCSLPQILRFHTGCPAVEPLGEGRLRLIGHSRDSILQTNPPLEFRITPDACGFTIGIEALIPTNITTIHTTITTKPKA